MFCRRVPGVWMKFWSLKRTMTIIPHQRLSIARCLRVSISTVRGAQTDKTSHFREATLPTELGTKNGLENLVMSKLTGAFWYSGPRSLLVPLGRTFTKVCSGRLQSKLSRDRRKLLKRGVGNLSGTASYSLG